MFNLNRALLIAGMRLGISDAMEMIAPPVARPGSRPRFVKRGFHRNRTTYHPTNGNRECARRRRQIAEGRLKAENGLLSAGEN